MRPSRPIDVELAVLTGLSIGILTGFAQFGVRAVRVLVRHEAPFGSPEMIWTAPLATGLLFAGVAAVVWLGARARRRPPTWRWSSGISLTLALLSGLLIWPRLHPAAAAVLALGAGFQLSRLVSVPPRRLLRWVTVGLTTIIAVIGLDRTLGRRLAERRAISHLVTAEPSAPNVLLVVLDAVRASNLSAYGYGRPTTPTLDWIAKHGVRFAHAISPAPWTRPAHASIFTGRDAARLSADWFHPLDSSDRTLAEALRSTGYATAAFVGNVWFAGRTSGFGRGFVHFEDYPLTAGMVLRSSVLAARLLAWTRAGHAADRDPPDRKWTPGISRSLLGWLDQVGPHPFFAFLNLYDAHGPYGPPVPVPGFESPAPYLRSLPQRPDSSAPIDPNQVAGAMAAYDASIRYLDTSLGRLFDSLRVRGELEHTVLIITADHGEEFYEHGVPEHGSTLYIQSLAVPLFLFAPGRVPAGSVIETPVSTRMIAATVADLIGLPSSTFPGPSLTALFGHPDPPPSVGPLFSEVTFAPRLASWYPVSKGDMRSVVEDGYHLIERGDGVKELYDLTRDPEERNNLAPTAASGENEPLTKRLTRMEAVPWPAR